jgi:hypothetical protein
MLRVTKRDGKNMWTNHIGVRMSQGLIVTAEGWFVGWRDSVGRKVAWFISWVDG